MAFFDWWRCLTGDADALYEQGLLQLNQGSLWHAICFFDDALKAAPDHYQSYLMRGIAKIRFDKIEEGDEDLKMAREYWPKEAPREATAEYHFWTGYVAYFQANFAEVHTNFERCIELNWKLVKVHKLYAKMYLALDDPKSAHPHIDAFLDESFDDAEMLFHKAIVLYHLEEDEEADRYIEFALAQEPDNLDILFERATTLIERDEFEQAIGYLDRIMEISPNRYTALRPYLQELTEESKITAAVKLGDYLVDYFPDSLELLADRSALQIDHGDPVKAVELLDHSLELENSFSVIWNLRGMAHCKLENWDEAITDYTNAIELDPNDHLAYTNRGGVHFSLEKWDTAIADYTKAIQLDPEDHLAFTNRGTAHCNLENWDAAISDYTKAIELDAKDHLAFTNRGTAHCNLENWDAAITDSTKAIELDPNKHIPFINRGMAHCQLENWDAAISDYTTAIELDPANHKLLINRGLAYQFLEKYHQALSDWRQCLISDSRHVLANLNLAHLLAACPDENLRDLSQALKHAETACMESKEQHPFALDSMAIVNSLMGEFEEAIAWQEKAINQMPEDHQYLPTMMQDLENYRSEKPYQFRSEIISFTAAERKAFGENSDEIPE